MYLMNIYLYVRYCTDNGSILTITDLVNIYKTQGDDIQEDVSVTHSNFGFLSKCLEIEMSCVYTVLLILQVVYDSNTTNVDRRDTGL